MAASIAAHDRRGLVELSVRRWDVDDVHEAGLYAKIQLPRHERRCLSHTLLNRYNRDLELVSFAVSKTA